MGGTQILYDGLVVPYEPQPNKIKDYYETGYTLSNTVTVSSGGENGGFSLSLANMHNNTILPGSSMTETRSTWALPKRSVS